MEKYWKDKKIDMLKMKDEFGVLKKKITT
jgi:hypothetical protein